MVLFYFEWSALLMLDQEKQEEVIPQQVPCRRQTLADLIHHFPINFKVHKYYLWFIYLHWKVLQCNTTNFCGHLKISHLWTQMFDIWCHCVVLWQVLKVQLAVRALTLQILMLLLLLLERISAFQLLESKFYCLSGVICTISQKIIIMMSRVGCDCLGECSPDSDWCLNNLHCSPL